MGEHIIGNLLRKWKKDYNDNVISINDLIIKEMEGENLSCNQYQAIHNYYSFRINTLSNALNSSLFKDKSYKLRLAANLIPYKEFI